MTEPYPPMILAEDFAENHNVAWRIEPGKKDESNPLMAPKFPWDAGAVFSHGTVLIDPADGLYKAWYLSTPRIRGAFPHLRQLTYATSEDGREWVRPELDVYPCEGHERTNILLGIGTGGITSQVSVFIHPEAEPIAGSPTTREAYGGRPFVSSDGLAVFQLRDGRYVIHNKVQLPAPPGGYVRYDVGAGECRTIARRESPDGRQWGHTYENILTPDWRDPQDTQFMELMMNEYNDGFIAIVSVYHTLAGTVDLQLAGSKDGRKWFRPGRRPCVPLEPLGEIGGGLLWPMRGFVIDRDQAHIYYAGMKGLHGGVYSEGPKNGVHEGAFCRASWELGRMWAAMHYSGTDEDAWLTTRPMACGGKTLFINAVTRGAGKVEAELLTGTPWQPGEPLEGYSRADCNAFRGDEKCAALTWNGRANAAVDNALLRIYLTDAFLYGYEWRSGE